MPYFCTTPGCYFQKKNYSYPIAGNCQECGQPYVLKVEFDDFELDVINNYPYVIAFPFKRMIEEVDYFTKFSILKDVFVNTLKYNALMVATDYFKSSLKSEVINKLFIEKLHRPNHGEWNGFLYKSIEFLEANNHTFFVQELPFAYHHIETGKKNNLPKKYDINKTYTDKKGKLRTETENATAIRTLLYYRNEKFAHTQTILQQEAKAVYYTCYAILKDFLTAISFCKNYPMYKADRVNYYSLMGATVTESGRITEVLNEKDTVWIENSKGDKMSLLPFFVQPSQHIAGASNTMQVLMYEGNTGVDGRIIFDSPESFKPEAQGEILNIFYSLLANKQMLASYTEQDITTELLQARFAELNKRVFKELTSEQKLLIGIYQKREAAEVALLSWAGARAGLFILVAEAGSGKTNVLWNIKQQYEEKFGLDVLLLRASRFEYDTLAEQLQQLLHLTPNFNYAQSKAFKYTQARPLMLLIDGGNEHPNPMLLLQSLYSFLQLFTIGSIKIVLTWRVNNDSELPSLPTNDQNLLYTGNNAENTNNPKNYFVLPPLNKVELQGAWNQYVASKQARFTMLFTFNELTLHDRPLTDQLHNPLLLKLFLELNNNKTLDKLTQGFTNIWADWWKQRIAKQPNHALFLMHLAVLMADKQVSRLPLDTLYNDDTIGPFVRNYQIDSPYQQLLQSNVLTQYSISNRMYVSITIEATLHYALSQYLIQQRKAYQFGLYITKGQHWQQAIAYCLWDAALKGKQNLLLAAINNTAIPVQLLAKPLATAFITTAVEPLVAIVLNNAGEREWEILHKAVKVLDRSQKKQLVAIIVKTTEFRIDLSICKCQDFIGNYLKVYDKDFSIEVSEQLMDIIQYQEKNERLINLVFNLISYYIYIGLYRKARKHCVNINGYHHKVDRIIAINYSYLSTIYFKEGHYDRALDYSYRSLRKKMKIYRNEHPKIATSYSKIASILETKGKYDEAMNYYQKCLEIELKFYGEQHPEIATSYSNIASILKTKGKYNEAMNYYQKSLEIELKFYGVQHPEIATSYSNIASVLKTNGNYDEAMNYYQKSLEIELKFYSEQHPYIATSYGNIASILKTKGNYDEAMEYFLKGLYIKLKFYGEQHPYIATSCGNIASILKTKGNYDEAMEYYLKGLEIRRKFYGEQHPKIATSYSNLASILETKGNYDEAMNYYQKCLEIELKFYGEQHPEIAESYGCIASILRIKGNYQEALSYYQKSLDIKLKFYDEQHSTIATTYNNMALTYEKISNYILALEFYSKALLLKQQFLPTNHPSIAIIQRHLADVHIHQNNLENAITHLDAANIIYMQHFETSHPKIADLNNSYGLYHEKQGSFTVALSYYEKAYEVKLALLGTENKEVKAIASSIERVKSCL